MGATGKFREIRIFDHKPAPCWRVNEVDLCTVKMWVKFPLCGEHYAVKVVFRINGDMEFGIEVEGILHSTTSAAENADSQKRVVSEVLRILDLFYFVYRYRSYGY